MPFIRVNHTDGSVIDVNVESIIQFYKKGGVTHIDLCDNISHPIIDEPRQLRGYIKRAEGTLPVKGEVPAEADFDPALG